MLFLVLFTIFFPIWNLAPLFKNFRDRNFYNSLLVISVIIIFVFKILDYSGIYKLSKTDSYLEYTFLLFLLLFKLFNNLSIRIQKRDLYFSNSRNFIKCEESQHATSLDFIFQMLLSFTPFMIMAVKYFFGK
jgi:hypothetical protein